MALVRVNRESPCPVCGKHDWCLVAADKCVAICARVQSALPKGESGWLHKLTDDWQRRAWRPVQRRATKPTIDWLALCNQYRRECVRGSLGSLANTLGVSVDSLKRLRVGWNDQRRAFSFPMRDASGNPCGIRYRSYSGAKFSETHSKEGLFFLPADLLPDFLVVVEGASDAAAVMDLGFLSVIGRANCRGNVDQIENLCRRLNPRSVVLIPDADSVGVQGASQLRLRIERQPISVKTLVLPSGIKDARACVQSTKNADWLRDQIGTLSGTSSSKQEATSNDNES